MWSSLHIDVWPDKQYKAVTNDAAVPENMTVSIICTGQIKSYRKYWSELFLPFISISFSLPHLLKVIKISCVLLQNMHDSYFSTISVKQCLFDVVRILWSTPLLVNCLHDDLNIILLLHEGQMLFPHEHKNSTTKSAVQRLPKS